MDEGLTAPAAVFDIFKVKVKCDHHRLNTKGWFYQGNSDVMCPACESKFEIFRKAYNIKTGDIYHYYGLACLDCAKIFVPQEIDINSRKMLKEHSIPIKEKKLTGKEIKKNPKARIEQSLLKLKRTDFHYYFDDYFPKYSHEYSCSDLSQKIVSFKGSLEDLPFFLSELNGLNIPCGVALCTVPGHDKEIVDSNLRILCKTFCELKGFVDLSKCLVRHKTIGKSSYGRTNREKEKSLSSIALKHSYLIKDKIIILIDDITVTGNTLIACKDILMEGEPFEIYCISFGHSYSNLK